MMRILFCGGGSIGHLAPSLAVWEELKEKIPHARGLFVCSFKKDDRAFLRANSLPFVPVIASRCNSIVRAMLFPFLFSLGCLEALCILLTFRPHVIFAKGGYVSVPICLAGWMLRYPIVLHESDRVMGRANRILLRFSRHLCIGAPQKDIANAQVVSAAKIAVSATGNPVRKNLFGGTKDGGRRVTGFSGKKPVLLVIGGSQGAHALNEAIWSALDSLIDVCDVIHIAGRGKVNDAKRHGRYVQREVFFEELENIYAIADIVVSRAGAGAIAELAATGKASILVPLPDLAHRHQEENAHFLSMARAAIVIRQEKLHAMLVPAVRELCNDEQKRRSLAKQLRTFADPDAGERIANILIAYGKREV